MKTNIIKLLALLLLCCAMIGCGKDKSQGSIFGVVTDFTTGDPVSNANVRLNPRGETTLTGSDGTFQFFYLSNGRYSLSLSKNGYADLDDDYVIEVTNGNNVRRDVQLKQSRVVVTVNGIEVDTLDFGSDISYNRITFLVTNSTMAAINVDFSSSSDWIDLEHIGAALPSNHGCSVEIEIIRSRLRIGNNIGYVYVNSGSFSKTLVVKATRV